MKRNRIPFRIFILAPTLVLQKIDTFSIHFFLARRLGAHRNRNPTLSTRFNLLSNRSVCNFNFYYKILP